MIRDERRKQALDKLTAKSPPRAAPAARGTAETVQAIALGQDPNAIEALYKLQRQSAAAAPLIASMTIQGATPAQQVTSQNAMIDLIRASDFWAEVHVDHHTDIPLYGRSVQSGPNHCFECLRVQESFDPRVRRSTTYNDVHRAGRSSPDSFSLIPGRDSLDSDAIDYARRPQENWLERPGDHEQEGGADQGPILESRYPQQPETRAGNHLRTAAVEEDQEDLEEQWLHRFARPPQHLLDRLASRERVIPTSSTALGGCSPGLGTITEDSHSPDIEELLRLRRQSREEVEDMLAQQSETRSPRRVRGHLRVPYFEHPPTPPPRETVSQVQNLFMHEASPSITRLENTEAHLWRPVQQIQTSRQDDFSSTTHVEVPRAYLWQPGQQAPFNYLQEALASTANFNPPPKSRTTPLHGGRSLTEAESQPLPNFPELWILEDEEEPDSQLIFPHSLAGQTARSQFIQYLSLPPHLTIAEVEESGSSKLAHWLKEPRISNPRGSSGVQLYRNMEQEQARMTFLETWRSIDWDRAPFQAHQPSEQDVAVNVPLPQADWDECEFLGVTEMVDTVGLQLAEEDLYGADDDDCNDVEEDREAQQSQVYRFLRRVTTPIEPSETHLRHRNDRPSSLRSELILEELEEDAIVDDEEEEWAISGPWNLDREKEKVNTISSDVANLGRRLC